MENMRLMVLVISQLSRKEEPPRVKGYPGFVIQQSIVDQKRSELAVEERNAEKLKMNLQGNCKHRFKKTFGESQHYFYGLTPSKLIPKSFEDPQRIILLLKTCIYCGFEKKIPEGNFWKRCHKCWSRMKFQGIEEKWGQKMAVYECCRKEKCGHTVFTYSLPGYAK